jgi:hypothetical protein
MPSICAVLLTRKWPNAFFKSILAVIFWQKLVKLVVSKLQSDAYVKLKPSHYWWNRFHGFTLSD